MLQRGPELRMEVLVCFIEGVMFKTHLADESLFPTSSA